MTPSEQLAHSRLAIIQELRGRKRPRSRSAEGPAEPGDDEVGADESSLRRRLGGMSGAAKAWWSRHPAHLIVEMATPSMQAYMRKRPFLVLGAAAGLGATLVLTRAWRLISLGTVVVALLKTSQFSGAVMSALSQVQDWQAPEQDRPEQG